MINKKQTIGTESQKLADKYILIYEQLRKDKDIVIRAKAENLAKHDLIVKKLVAEFAIEKLNKHIDKISKEEGY